MGRTLSLLTVACMALLGCQNTPMYDAGTGMSSSDPDDFYWAKRKKDDCGGINDELYRRDCERKLDMERARGKGKP